MGSTCRIVVTFVFLRAQEHTGAILAPRKLSLSSVGVRRQPWSSSAEAQSKHGLGSVRAESAYNLRSVRLKCELSLSLVGPQLELVKLRKMKVAARGLGARLAVVAPRYEPVDAPARVLAGRLLRPRRPVRPDAPPTGLHLLATLVSEPAFKNWPKRRPEDGD